MTFLYRYDLKELKEIGSQFQNDGRDLMQKCSNDITEGNLSETAAAIEYPYPFSGITTTMSSSMMSNSKMISDEDLFIEYENNACNNNNAEEEQNIIMNNNL